MLAAGPLLGLGAVLTLAPGTNATSPFINGITTPHYLHVDALSWIFALIFCMMAVIGGIYACHNSNRMEAFCSMTYAGGALGVTSPGLADSDLLFGADGGYFAVSYLV